MDSLLQTLLSWQFVLFSLGVASIIYVLRIVVEFMMRYWKVSAKKTKIWTDLFLPILPVILGATGGVLFSSYPYPEGLNATSDKFIFGAVAGLLSTLLYRVIKSLLIQKTKSDTK